MSKSFNQLKSLLEGKTINAIEPVNSCESICKFVLTDGTAFSLCATELGFWIEMSAGPNGYQSLNDLITEYYNDIVPDFQNGWNRSYVLPPMIDASNDSIIFLSPEGKTYSISRSNLTDWEKLILANDDGVAILADAAKEQGTTWRLYFSKNSDCPKELIWGPENI